MKITKQMVMVFFSGLLGFSTEAQPYEGAPSLAFLTPKWGVGQFRKYHVTYSHGAIWNKTDTSYYDRQEMDLLISYDSIVILTAGHYMSMRITNSTTKNTSRLDQQMAKAREGLVFRFSTARFGGFTELINGEEAKWHVRAFFQKVKPERMEKSQEAEELASWENRLNDENELNLYLTAEFRQLCELLGMKVLFHEKIQKESTFRPLVDSKHVPATSTTTASWNKEYIKTTVLQETGPITSTVIPRGEDSIIDEPFDVVMEHKFIEELEVDPKRWPVRSMTCQTAKGMNLELFVSRTIEIIP